MDTDPEGEGEETEADQTRTDAFEREAFHPSKHGVVTRFPYRVQTVPRGQRH